MFVRKAATIEQSLSFLGLGELIPLLHTLAETAENSDIHGEGTTLAHLRLLHHHLPQVVDVDLLLAAILHDVGKHGTRDVDFRDHEEFGYESIKKVLPEGNYSKEKILWLIRHHGDFLSKPLSQLEVNHRWFADTLLLFYFDSAGMIPTRLETFDKVVSYYTHTLNIDPPKVTALHLTPRCNLKCTTCYSAIALPTADRDGSLHTAKEWPQPELTLEVLSGTLADLRILGNKEVILFGGEPFLRIDLEQILSLCISYGFDPEIVTNGTLITDKKLESVWNAGLRKIAISVDGAKSGHAMVRGRGSYRTVIENVLRAKAYGFRVRVNTVVTAQTCHTIEPLIREMLDVVDIHKILYFTPFRNNDRRYWMPPGEWISFCQEIRNTFEPYDGITQIVIEQPYARENIPRCRLVYPIVRSDGELLPCVMFIASDHSLGNVYAKRFLHLWVNERNWAQINQVNATCIGYNYLFSGDINQFPHQLKVWHERGFAPGCPLLSQKISTTGNPGDLTSRATR